MTSRIRQLVIVAISGVAISIFLTIFGLPESTPNQIIALELGALPLSIALAAGNLILIERAQRAPGPRGRLGLIIGSVTSGFGLVVMALAYLTGPRGLVQFGQFLVFLGLLGVLLVAIALQTSRTTEWFGLEDVTDGVEIDGEETSDQAAEQPTTSL